MGRDEDELGHARHREKAKGSRQNEIGRNGVGWPQAKMKIAVTIRRLAIHESADCHVIPAKLRVVWHRFWKSGNHMPSKEPTGDLIADRRTVEVVGISALDLHGRDFANP